jgi:hypothetical protein
MMRMEGDDQDDLKPTAATATAAVDQTGSIQDEALPQDMNTADVDSVAAAIPSGNDIKDRNEKIVEAVNEYHANLANELGKSKDDLKGIVAALLFILGEDEFWAQEQALQKRR